MGQVKLPDTSSVLSVAIVQQYYLNGTVQKKNNEPMNTHCPLTHCDKYKSSRPQNKNCVMSPVCLAYLGHLFHQFQFQQHRQQLVD